jgi:hypothetical protein
MNRLEVSNGFSSSIDESFSRANYFLSRAMRAGSRLLSGASMEDNSLLCEHTLLTSGEVAQSNAVYVGWPAKRAKIIPH